MNESEILSQASPGLGKSAGAETAIAESSSETMTETRISLSDGRQQREMFMTAEGGTAIERGQVGGKKTRGACQQGQSFRKIDITVRIYTIQEEDKVSQERTRARMGLDA